MNSHLSAAFRPRNASDTTSSLKWSCGASLRVEFCGLGPITSLHAVSRRLASLSAAAAAAAAVAKAVTPVTVSVTDGAEVDAEGRQSRSRGLTAAVAVCFCVALTLELCTVV